ncbi:MAG: secondary thiamine-phosphate synthase enzyme YjbQ [Vicinamibacterales bacterium]
MTTIAHGRACEHGTLQVPTTRPTEFVDITPALQAWSASAGRWSGTLTIQSRHTTAAIAINEAEPLLLADMEALLERLAPRTHPYWHDELPLRGQVPTSEPRNGHAHCRSLLLPSTAVVIVVNGALQLGRWQRVFLVELDGPRQREVSLLAMGEVLP